MATPLNKLIIIGSAFSRSWSSLPPGGIITLYRHKGKWRDLKCRYSFSSLKVARNYYARLWPKHVKIRLFEKECTLFVSFPFDVHMSKAFRHRTSRQQAKIDTFASIYRGAETYRYRSDIPNESAKPVRDMIEVDYTAIEKQVSAFYNDGRQPE